MTQTPVGIRCQECSGRGRIRIRKPGFLMGRDPHLTYLLIAVNLALFLITNPRPLSGGLSGSVPLTVNNLLNVIDGQTYINFHTAINPGGEIRGQLMR